MKLAALRSHFTHWREWELNPVVIKELRQGVRSWTVTGMLLLFLVVLFITSLGFLVTQSFDVNQNLELGGTMFSSFMVILAGASILFIPLYTAVRVAVERQENNPDLLYVTTLSPFRIILGKFLCSAYIILLFFSACMPFMAFTNLLRGVDLPTVFFILSFLFLLTCAANMVAIFFACLPISRAFKILLAIGGIVGSFSIIVSAVEISFELMRSGVGAMMVGRNFWAGTLTYAGIVLAVTGLFFVLSVALISPPSANRALPVRVYLTVIWLLGGGLCLNWVIHTGYPSRIYAWATPTMLLLLPALLVTISNTDQLSLRVRRTIPQSRFKRVPAFFLYNGAAGGLLWLAAIVGVTAAVTQQILISFGKSVGMAGDSLLLFGCTVVYAFDYSLTALFIHREFLPHRPAKLTGLLAVLLAGGWAIAPSIFLFFVNRLTWRSVEGFQPGNIVNIFSIRDQPTQSMHMWFSLGWLVVILLVNMKWFMRQVKNFKPPIQVAPDNTPSGQ